MASATNGRPAQLVMPAGIRSVDLAARNGANGNGRPRPMGVRSKRSAPLQGLSRRPIAQDDLFGEIGTSGLRQYGGFVLEEWLSTLRGRHGAWKYREMMDNSPVAAGIIFAIKMLAREAEWPVEDDIEMRGLPKGVGFIKSNMDDMSHTWGDFVSEALSMIGYGYAPHEEVFKRRDGTNPVPPSAYMEALDVEALSGNVREEDTSDPASSKYEDGLIGWRRLPMRAQETTFRWLFKGYSGIAGLEQIDWHGGKHKIPIEKMLLFRTETTRNSPEGRSLLRSAWTSYFALQNIQGIELIGIERDLAGLPVLTPPEGVDLNDPSNRKLYEIAVEVVTGIRRDEDEGIVLPSAEWKLELVSSGGSRQIDTDPIIRRYEQRMTVSLLADFLLLGQDALGSYAMVDIKSELFGVAVDVILDLICEVFNRYAIPRLLALNGLKPRVLPKITHTSAGRMDLRTVGEFLSNLSLAGAPIPWTEELMAHLFRGGGLPRPDFTPSKIITPPMPNEQAHDVQWRPSWGSEQGPAPLPPSGKQHEHLAKAEGRTGAMVAFYPSRDVARALAQAGGEDAEEIHLTLAFLGDAADLADVERLRTVIAGFAASCPPLTGSVSGTGIFTAGPERVLYASPDVPQLPQVRQRLVEHLEHAGFPPPREHGFTPHLTLAYGHDGPPPSIAHLPLTFDRLTLMVGRQGYDFPLAPDAIVKAELPEGEGTVANVAPLLRDRQQALATQLEREMESALMQLGQQAATGYATVARDAHTPREADRLAGSVMAKARVGPFVQSRLRPLLANHAGRVTEDTFRTLRPVLGAGQLSEAAVRRIAASTGHHLRQRDLEPQVRSCVAEAIREGLEAGESPVQIAERIRQSVPRGRFRLAGQRWRAGLIARTETASLQRQAALESYRATPSLTHVQSEGGEIIPIDQAEELAAQMHPDDPVVFLPVLRERELAIA